MSLPGAFLSMRQHLFSPSARTESLYVDAFKEGCGKFAQPLVSWADHTAGTHKAGSALHKATLHAGFGFGFGFQVWCGCNMLAFLRCRALAKDLASTQTMRLTEVSEEAVASKPFSSKASQTTQPSMSVEEEGVI